MFIRFWSSIPFYSQILGVSWKKKFFILSFLLCMMLLLPLWDSFGCFFLFLTFCNFIRIWLAVGFLVFKVMPIYYYVGQKIYKIQSGKFIFIMFFHILFLYIKWNFYHSISPFYFSNISVISGSWTSLGTVFLFFLFSSFLFYLLEDFLELIFKALYHSPVTLILIFKFSHDVFILDILVVFSFRVINVITEAINCIDFFFICFLYYFIQLHF